KILFGEIGVSARNAARQFFYAALQAATILPKAPKFTITSYARAAQALSLMPGPESPLLSAKWQAQ
ncbi:hypothetical protein, partial [Xanthomonas euvesicatoria]|uniref:hypothetical protein n=1 Tax=Xanthomonas euvesicatoria TaxID=456327 RepID=UPI0019D328B9